MSLGGRHHPFAGTSRYEVVGRLGAGGMGVVYEAIDREKNVRVALKTMRLPDAAAIYRFKKEFRELADVTHPNLVGLYDLAASEGEIFYTMELVEGVDFLRHLTKRSSLVDAPTTPDVDAPRRVRARALSPMPSTQGAPVVDEERLRSLMRQLAEGVHALHAAGKLHRDLKPSNVMVTDEGRVVLLDFGLVKSKHATLDSVHGQGAGTAEYMSPEQATDGDLDEATDWYAVGVMLYEALTGRLPFVGPPLKILMDKQRLDPALPQGAPKDLSDLCMALLRRDPAKRPSWSAILEALGCDPPRSLRAEPPTPLPITSTLAQTFVGRERHLAVLRDAFARASSGKGASVFVHGSSGMGKSLLVRRFLDVLGGSNEAVVLTGRCFERESIPYKALDDLVDALTRHLAKLPANDAAAMLPRGVHALARLFPVLRRIPAVAEAPRRGAETPDPQELRRRAFVALRELFLRICDRHSVVVWIDDLQWGDVDSVAMLGELLRPPDPPSMLFIATFRSEDVGTSPALVALSALRHQLRGALDEREIEVGALKPEESLHLAASLLGPGGTHARLAEIIADEAKGSPFFLAELVRHAQSGAALRASTAGHSLRLGEVLSSRLEELPAEAIRLFETVCVAGHPIPRDVAASAAELSVEAEPTAVGVLRAARLVRTVRSPTGEEIETYHDRLREALVQTLPADALTHHHRRIARALEASGRNDPETLAVHLHAGGERERAAEQAVRAAERAATALAFHRAANWLRAALELGTFDGETARGLRIRLADSLVNAGRGNEAGDEYLTAVEGSRGALTLDLLRRAAEQKLFAGHLDEGLRTTRAVLAAVGMKLPETHRGAIAALIARQLQIALRGLRYKERDASQVAADVLTRIDVCWSIAIGLGVPDHVRAQYFVKRCLLLALQAGEVGRIARAIGLEMLSSATRGNRSVARTEELMNLGRGAADRANTAYAHVWIDFATAFARYLEGRWRVALDLSEAACTRLRDECTGVTWELDTAILTCLWSLDYLGEVRELSRRVPALLEDARARGDLYLLTSARIGRLNVVWLAQDDPARAERELEDAMSEWSQRLFTMQHAFALVARVHIDLYVGRAERGLQALRDRWNTLRAAFIFQVESMRIELLGLRARCLLAAAEASVDPSTALREAERDARRLERERAAWAKPLARLVRAAVAHARKQPARALEHLREAAEGFDASEMKLLATLARRRHGELLGGDEGRAMVERVDAFLKGQGIVSPARIADIYAPGFAPRSVALLGSGR